MYYANNVTLWGYRKQFTPVYLSVYFFFRFLPIFDFFTHFILTPHLSDRNRSYNTINDHNPKIYVDPNFRSSVEGPSLCQNRG